MNLPAFQLTLQFARTHFQNPDSLWHCEAKANSIPDMSKKPLQPEIFSPEKNRSALDTNGAQICILPDPQKMPVLSG